MIKSFCQIGAATYIVFCCSFFYSEILFSQIDPLPSISMLDSLSGNLRGLEVESFMSQRMRYQTAGSIAIIPEAVLKGYDGLSLQNALNTVPGVTMESRGYGGSQRINIRGSFLRSPFAVRNIKMYMQGIPLSSPDGTAPLDLIDPFDLRSIEVIKGPAGSMYGSGTGGVLLLKPQLPGSVFNVNHSSLHAEYGINRLTTSFTVPLSKKLSMRFSHVFQENQGYRLQEFNRKNNATLFANYQANDRLSYFGYLSYFDGQLALPGGLNAQQVEDDPRQANAFSIANNASLYRSRYFAGISQRLRLNETMSLLTSVYYSVSRKVNPYGTSSAYTRNGYKDEDNDGGGTRTEYQWNAMGDGDWKLTINAGGELQWDQFRSTEWTNRGGKPGDFKYSYNVDYFSWLGFAGLDLRWRNKVLLGISAGANSTRHNINAVGLNENATDSIAYFDPVVLPRFTVGYVVASGWSLHGSVSYGSSNPTVFEQVEIQQFGGVTGFASAGSLNPERGTNYEVSLKRESPSAQSLRWFAELTAYHFELKDAILPYSVERYFEPTNTFEDFTLYSNAGSTNQQGMEAAVSFSYLFKKKHKIEGWANGQWTRYTFNSYVLNGQDFRDKKIPGMPTTTLNTGLSLHLNNDRIVAHLNHFYFSSIALNNANSVFSNPYNLVNARVDFSVSRFIKDKFTVSLFVGVNNIFNTQYTSFLQTNAAFDRYYNPAPLRNAFGGISLKWI